MKPKTVVSIFTLLVLLTVAHAGDYAAAVANILKAHPKGYVFSVPATNRPHCDLVIKMAKEQGFKVNLVRTNGFLRIAATK